MGITPINVTQLDPFDLAGFQEAWRGWADERQSWLANNPDWARLQWN
jgi:hypothetical protein